MAVDTKVSFILSSVLTVTLLAASQTFKSQLAETKGMTILGGGMCSLLFMFLLTAIGNLEGMMLGKGFEIQLIPEGKIHSLYYIQYSHVARILRRGGGLRLSTNQKCSSTRHLDRGNPYPFTVKCWRYQSLPDNFADNNRNRYFKIIGYLAFLY